MTVTVINVVQATREYLRTYKIPSGKGENTFGFDGKFMDAAFCHEVR